MEKLGAALAVIALGVVVSVLLAWPVQWLWNNCLITAVDGLHPLAFWQALGIKILSDLLFKNTQTSK